LIHSIGLFTSIVPFSAIHLSAHQEGRVTGLRRALIGEVHRQQGNTKILPKGFSCEDLNEIRDLRDQAISTDARRMRDYNLNRTVYSSFWDTEPPSGGSFVFPLAAMMMGGKLRHRIGAIWFTCDGSPHAYPPKPMLRGSGFNNV
jgi:hypothetical protein